VFARRCDEGFEVSIQDEWYRKHVLKFVEFQNVMTFFGILDVLGGMLTAFWNMILETMLVTEWMQAIRTNVILTMALSSVTYETRKTCNQGVMKFVSFGQQQEIYVMGTLVAKLGSVYGN